jgi:2-dehydro-3-deoxy-D-arabinonate dehydratase
MKLHRTDRGVFAEREGLFFPLEETWDAIVDRADLRAHLERFCDSSTGVPALVGRSMAPIGTQEVWAAGVTYVRSRVARVEESKGSGGSVFYDRVYEAERPELFFKAAPWRVRGPGDAVRVRRDARWTVPEPEIALCVNSRGEIVGCTIGNDMSSRDIEGENPLYLPQAKIYDGACALGPALLVADGLPTDTLIEIEVRRGGAPVYEGETTFSRMKRAPVELVDFLYRETSFPHGSYLLTGTGVVPPDDFTLAAGDEVRIRVEAIGELVNIVEA